MTSIEKVYLSGSDTRLVVQEQARNLIGSDWRHKVYDDRYYCPPLADAIAIIEKARVDQLEYCSDSADCDDFHRRLVYAFLIDAYRERKRRPPYCFGIAESQDHAFNCMINSDLLLRFIEPQTSEIYLPHELPSGIVEIEW